MKKKKNFLWMKNMAPLYQSAEQLVARDLSNTV